MDDEWPVALIKDDFMFSDIQCMSPQGSSTCSSKSDAIYDGNIYFKDPFSCHQTNSFKQTALNNYSAANNNNYLENSDGSPCSSTSSTCSPETLDFEQLRNHLFLPNTRIADSLVHGGDGANDFIGQLTVQTGVANSVQQGLFDGRVGLGDVNGMTTFTDISPSILSQSNCFDGPGSSLCGLGGDNYTTSLTSTNLSSAFSLPSSNKATANSMAANEFTNEYFNQETNSLFAQNLNTINGDIGRDNGTVVVVKNEYDPNDEFDDDDESDEDKYNFTSKNRKQKSGRSEDAEYDSYSSECKRMAFNNGTESPSIFENEMGGKGQSLNAKTRSKMHDLAVRHRLITNQNTRGHGQIQLSAEEKRTLLQEGFQLPTRLPLSRDEEEALKIVRRKIKNKLSAQESRRKRKEYMDTLEKKVHAYFGDNMHLKNRIKHLEQLNQDLILQIKKLQSDSDNYQK